MEYLASNKIAIVDLGKAEVREEELEDRLVLERIGGAGVTTALYKTYEAEDPIVIGTGLLTGTLMPGSALGLVTAKSARTGKIAHAPLTLSLGLELKFSGFDYLVVKGVSPQPAVLWLHDGILDIEPAGELWGRDTWAVTDALRQTLGDDLIQVLAVGPTGEAGSSLGQLTINYWGSGDRWGFGGLLGSRKLKAIAARGMGLLEIADAEGFIGRCQALLTQVKSGAWAGKKGLPDMAAALGWGDIPGWLAPVVHRHKSCFNTPFASNTFLFLDEDPGKLEETEQAEPGFLATDLLALAGFQKLGLTAPDAGRVLKACARAGIDPDAAAALSLQAGTSGAEAVIQSLPTLQGTPDQGTSSPFSPWAPGKPIFADFGTPADEAWWTRRQALAYIFGIHPIFALMTPELNEVVLLELAGLGTGIEFTPEGLEKLIQDISG